MKYVNFLIKMMIFLVICTIVSISGLYAFAYFSDEISLNSENKIVMYDSDENIVYHGHGGKEWVKLSEISDYVKNGIISVEDKHFYNHQGFDYLRIVKSMYNNLKSKKITAGASTISMQYVKNMYLDFDKTWERKIEEAFLTINLETHYSKEEILEGYLNTINFGRGNFGIENASQYYFDKKSHNLTLEEALILVGIPRSPENYNPVGNFERSIERAKIVARSMLDNNYITEDEYNNLNFDNIILHGKKEINNLQTFMYYHDAVIDELKTINSVPKSLIKSGGIKIYTNLNVDIQRKLEEEINKEVQNDEVEMASIIVDPKTGGVTALTGGVNYAKSQFNRATQAERQVGSVIKPFLYYAALENNMTSSSTFKSAATSFVFADNQTYSPTNYASIYANKDITMAAAMAYSDNIFAVKTHLFLGEEVLVDTLNLAGIDKKIMPIPSLALGTLELSLLDFAHGYSTLANYGNYNDIYFIKRVEDLEGNIIYEHKENPEPVLNQDYVYILNELMTTTYDSAFIDHVSPTVISLRPKITRKYALKSGTTDYDYWFAGYNPDILMLIWCGNDINKNVDKIYSRKIKDIWAETIEYALKDKETTWYEPSDNIVALPLDGITGEYNPKSKHNTLFYFKKGSEPNF